MIKKPTLRIEQQQPRNIQRADIAPANGYSMVVDGHFKTQFSEGCDRITGQLSNASNKGLQRYGKEPDIGEKRTF